MNISKRFKIIGTGQYLPRQIITSEDLEVSLGLPSGWSYKFSGVRERRRAENENNAEMAANALNQAMQNADISMESIDLLISSSATFDYILPFQAALILKLMSKNGELNIPAMDVGTSCLETKSVSRPTGASLNCSRPNMWCWPPAPRRSSCLLPASMARLSLTPGAGWIWPRSRRAWA